MLAALGACGGGGGDSSGGGGNPPATNAAPTNVKLVEVSSGKAGELVASWLPASDDSTPANSLRYELHASVAADFVPSSATRIFQGTGANSATVSTGLTPGAQYTVRLVAIDALGLQTQSSSLTLRISSVDTVVRGDVKVLALADSAVQTVSVNQVTLQPGAAAPAVNEYISSGSGNGYLRRVTAVSSSGGQPVLTTRDASISEVISDVSVASQFRMVTIPKEITSQASGLSVRAAGADGQRVQVHWPDSRLRYEGLRSTLGSTDASTRKTRLAAPAQGGTTYEQGRWAKLGAPGFVQVGEGQEVAFDLIATLTDRSDPLFGERRKICKVEFSAISTEDAAGQPDKISLSAGAIRSSQSETDPYRVISGSFPVTLSASTGAASPKAYKVTARLRIEELSQDCDNQTFWDETVEREILIFAVNDATTFEKEDIPKKVFAGTGDFNVTNDIDMVFSPVLTFEHRLAGAELQYALIKLDATPRVEQTLTVTASAEGTVNMSQVIVPFRKFYKVYMAGSVPIVISGEYQVDMHIKGSVTGALDATEILTLGYEELSYGLQYQDGAYSLVKNIKPTYRLSMGGEGKAKAELEVSLEPQLKLTIYEALSGKILLKPYVTAEAGVEGHVQMDTEFDFNEQQVNMAADADYRLTSGNLKSGVKVFVGADLTIWKATLAAWPEKDKLQEYDLIPETTILGIPDLVAAADPTAAYATNTRAVRFVATATPVPNLLKVIYPSMADTLIPWRAFTNPRVVPVVGRDPADSTILATAEPAGTAWVDFKQPGTYVLRQGGYSSIGTWARQYTETTLEVADQNSNGIMDYWEERYHLQGSGAEISAADPDHDGLTNLQEWNAGTDPLVPDNPGTLQVSNGSPSIGQAIEVWLQDLWAAVKSVAFNFTNAVLVVANSATEHIEAVFNSGGVQTITATLRDSLGQTVATLTRSITVTGPQTTAVIAGATSDSAREPGPIANNGSTDDTTPTLSGTLSAGLTSGQKVNVYLDGSETHYYEVANVEGTNWTFTPPTPLSAGAHSFTVEVASFDDTPGPRSEPFGLTVLATAVETVSPGETTRTLEKNFAIAGKDLPTTGVTVSAPGDSRNECLAPNNLTATGFGVSCKLYKVGTQLLEVRRGTDVLGSVTVNVASNVTGVTWTSPSTSSSGTVKFGETVTFKVAGTNLLADAAMGFAVEKCGVSNAELPGGTNEARFYNCLFNNEAGAVAGQMPGVVKDAPGGQVLLEGWKVAVEVPVSQRSINPANGHAYEVIQCGSWSSCRVAALARGGDLVTIRNAAENAWLLANMLPLANGVYGLWIGLVETGQEGVWRWVSGEPVSYMNWRSGEPNNIYVDGRNESYVHIWRGDSVYTPGAWNDIVDEPVLSGVHIITQAIVEYNGAASPLTGPWDAWNGSSFTTAEVVTTAEGYLTKVHSNYGTMRGRLSTLIDGDNFRIELRAKTSAPAGTQGFTLHVGNAYTSGQRNGNGDVASTRGVQLTAGMADAINIMTSTGTIGGAQPGQTASTEWNTYSFNVANAEVVFLINGVEKYRKPYTGTIGPLDTLVVYGQNNAVLDPSSIRITSIPGGTVNPSNGHRYELITCGTWTQCRDSARSRGGELATIRTQAESDWLIAQMTPLMTTTGVWIGYEKVGLSWNWSSGDAASFTNWAPGEPNNMGLNEQCAVFLKPAHGNWYGMWNDGNCASGDMSQAIIEFTR